MSLGSVCPNSLVVYRDLQAQQRSSNMVMDRLLDQIVGGIEKENELLENENMLHTENHVLLEKQLLQGATDRMRLQCEVCSVRVVMDTRSLIENCVREYYTSPADLKKYNRDADRVFGFIKESVLVNAGDKSPKPDFEGLL